MTEKLSELLRCPFCGGEARLSESGIPDPEGCDYFVGCGACGSYMGDYSETDAVSAWNTRSNNHEALKNRVEELEAENKKLKKEVAASNRGAKTNMELAKLCIDREEVLKAKYKELEAKQ